MSNIIKNVISSTTHKKICLSVNANIMMTQIFHEIRYDLKGHPRSYKTKFMANSSSTFVYGPILMKICMNANFMKTQLNVTFMFLL